MICATRRPSTSLTSMSTRDPRDNSANEAKSSPRKMLVLGVTAIGTRPCDVSTKMLALAKSMPTTRPETTACERADPSASGKACAQGGGSATANPVPAVPRTAANVAVAKIRSQAISLCQRMSPSRRSPFDAPARPASRRKLACLSHSNASLYEALAPAAPSPPSRARSMIARKLFTDASSAFLPASTSRSAISERSGVRDPNIFRPS